MPRGVNPKIRKPRDAQIVDALPAVQLRADRTNLEGVTVRRSGTSSNPLSGVGLRGAAVSEPLVRGRLNKTVLFTVLFTVGSQSVLVGDKVS